MECTPNKDKNGVDKYWPPPDYYFTEEDSPSNWVLVFDSSNNPQVKACTIDKAVEHLTGKGLLFTLMRAVLCTYPMFCTPDILLDLMLARVNITTHHIEFDEDKTIFRQRKQIPIILRTSNLARRWMDTRPWDFAKYSPLNDKMIVFIDIITEIGKKVIKYHERITQILTRALHAAEYKSIQYGPLITREESVRRAQELVIEGKSGIEDIKSFRSPSSLKRLCVDVILRCMDIYTVVGIVPDRTITTTTTHMSDIESMNNNCSSISDLPIELQEYISFGCHMEPLDRHISLMKSITQHLSYSEKERDSSLSLLSPLLLGINTIQDMPVKAIARQVTLLQWTMFSRTTTDDFLTTEGFSKVNRNMYNDKLATWSYSLMVNTTSQKHKIILFEYLLILAKELLSLNNYSGSEAIFSSLTRMAHGTLIDMKDNTLFKKLQDLYSRGCGFNQYRKSLSMVNPPCIPWIMVSSIDVMFINEGSSSLLDDGVINMNKYKKLHRVASELQQFQIVPYTFCVEDQILGFLLSMLECY